MPGSTHKALVRVLALRMNALRYKVIAGDWNYPLLGSRQLRKPPAVGKHQPDLVGWRVEPPRLCIGEAKTAGDLEGARTRRQLVDFCKVEGGCVLVAVPNRALPRLREIVLELGLREGPALECIGVPEPLLDG